MKKKILSLVIAIMFIIPCVLGLTACGPEPETPHTHEYTAWGLCSCGEYKGTTLTLGTASAATDVEANGTAYYRVPVVNGMAYYRTLTNFASAHMKVYTKDGTEVTMGANRNNSYLATYNGYVYFVYSGDTLAVANATLTVTNAVQECTAVTTSVGTQENQNIIISQGTYTPTYIKANILSAGTYQLVLEGATNFGEEDMTITVFDTAGNEHTMTADWQFTVSQADVDAGITYYYIRMVKVQGSTHNSVSSHQLIQEVV